jgi:hypothetical protein
LGWPDHEPTIYRTRGDYTTDTFWKIDYVYTCSYTCKLYIYNNIINNSYNILYVFIIQSNCKECFDKDYLVRNQDNCVNVICYLSELAQYKLRMFVWYKADLILSNVTWNETWLCVVIIGCTKKLLWKNKDRPGWIQRENNDVNVYATSKSSLSYLCGATDVFTFLCLYVVVNIANEDKKLQTPADIIPLYAWKI